MVLSDDTFKMNKHTKDTYNYVGKTTRCVNTNIKTESEQSSTLYYSTHFYGAEGIYSHFGYWQKEKLSVLLDKTAFNQSYKFCLSEKNYDFYVMAQRYDVEGDLNLSDQFYIASFEHLDHNALSSAFTFNFKDLNGNVHDRVLFENDNIIFTSSDDIAKEMKLQKDGHIFTLVYPTNMDFSKTYKVQFFNAAEGSSMGASIFELSFLNKEPKFKFVKVDKQAKISSFSFDEIKGEKLKVTFNFENKFKTNQEYKVCLMDGSATKSVLESFSLLPNEKMTQIFEIPVADLIMNPKLTIRLNSDRRVLDNMDLANAFGNDLKTHWASKSIISLLSRQVAFYPETKNQTGLNLSDTMAFEPNTPITRGEFAAYMTRFAKLDLGVDLKAIADEKNLEVSLSDVPSNHQYATEIMMVAEAGLINGSNGKFNPNQTISRQDAAAIFKRLMVFATKEENPQSTNELSRIVAKYADAKHISKYAVDGVNFCVANKIMSGNQSNRMLPKASISRGEVCTILEFMSHLDLEKLDW